MSEEILHVDLLAFEQGNPEQRRAVVDGVMRSLSTGFVFTTSDLSEDLLDTAYGMLGDFFALAPVDKARSHAPGAHGQTGYTGLLVETAATAKMADWKEMVNWGRNVPPNHPLRRRYPHQYADPVFPESEVPGIGAVLGTFHDQLVELQTRFLRIIAVGLGAHESFFDSMVRDGATLSRAIHYPAMTEAPGGIGGGHVWSAEHADINLITALPRATGPGLQVEVAHGWVDAVPPPHHAIINTGLMLERISNARLRAGRHRVVSADPARARMSVVQFLHPAPWTILAPLSTCVDDRHPQRWAPIEAGALLDQVLWDINLLGRP